MENTQTNKYHQTGERWGFYSFMGKSIGMTPEVASDKNARRAYILGYLARQKPSFYKQKQALSRAFDISKKYKLPGNRVYQGFGSEKYGQTQVRKALDERFFGDLIKEDKETTKEKVLDTYELMQDYIPGRWNDLSPHANAIASD
jgi:hypothetical protein